MTDKQIKFCEEYLIDLNKTRAAIRAGYSSKTAAQEGERLYKNVQVRARIDKAIAAQSRRTGVNADRVIRELARVGLLNPDNVVNFKDATVKGDATDDDLAAIASVRVKTSSGDSGDSVEREIKFHDKLKALELLGKHLGMFTDKLNISGEDTVKIIDNIPDAPAEKSQGDDKNETG